MRQYYLLLAEYWHGERQQDWRAYLSFCSMTKAEGRPKPRDLFPSFRIEAAGEAEDLEIPDGLQPGFESDDIDAVQNFDEVSGALGVTDTPWT